MNNITIRICRFSEECFRYIPTRCNQLHIQNSCEEYFQKRDYEILKREDDRERQEELRLDEEKRRIK